MKPLPKYQEKFIALLKEAEEELGSPLSVTVKCIVTRSYLDGPAAVTSISQDHTEYVCDIGTPGRYY